MIISKECSVDPLEITIQIVYYGVCAVLLLFGYFRSLTWPVRTVLAIIMMSSIRFYMVGFKIEKHMKESIKEVLMAIGHAVVYQFNAIVFLKGSREYKSLKILAISFWFILCMFLKFYLSGLVEADKIVLYVVYFVFGNILISVNLSYHL